MKGILLRLSEGLLADFEAIRPAILTRPDLAPRGKISLADVLRLALVRGYRALVEELRDTKAHAA